MDVVPIVSSPDPRIVSSLDGTDIATYESGDPDGPVVMAVHGFASSAPYNWYATGWVRDLVHGGFRVISLDQRGHGASGKPHAAARYTMDGLVRDVISVLDAYMADRVAYLGYSLGARVGWRLAHENPERVSHAVLGGIPDGDPLTGFKVESARAHIEGGTPITDKLTRTYLTMAAGIRGNDLTALVSLVEGVRGAPRPAADNAPGQPVLFATGSEDPIIEASRTLSRVTAQGSFVEIPGRNHFTTPKSREFRSAAVEFFTERNDSGPRRARIRHP